MAAQKDVSRQTKFAIGLGVLLVIAIAYLAYTWFAPAQVPQSRLAAVDPQRRGDPSEETPQYSKVLQDFNTNKANNALSGGSSYISVPSTRAEPVAPAGDAQNTMPIATPAETYPAQQYVPVPQQAVYQQPTAPVAPEQITALLNSWKAPDSGVATVAKDSSAFAASFAPQPARHEAQQQLAGHQGPTAAPASRPLVGGFETVPALLQTSIDTDENSVVEASIPTGPYAGAMVRAAGYKRINESVDMTFTEMWLNGRMYKIVAKPVDQTTGRTALSGDVNRRWFERIILPAFAKGLGATAQQFENSGTTAVTTPLGGVVQTFPNMPSAASLAGTFIAGLGTQAGEVLANDASQVPQKQVLVEAGSTIGIKFLAPVLASDEIGVEKGASNAFDAQALNALSQPASRPNQPMPQQTTARQPQGYLTYPSQGVVQPMRGYPQPY